MRALAIVLLIMIASSAALAGNALETIERVGRVVQVFRNVSAEPGQPVPARNPYPGIRQAAERQFPLEWDLKRGIVDASRGGGYSSPWKWSALSADTVRASVETVGAQLGMPISPEDRQVAATQDRTVGAGYDPDTAPAQGLQAAPQGVISVTVTWAGWVKTITGKARRDNKEVRYCEEVYRIRLTATVTSLVSGLGSYSAQAEGESRATYTEGEVGSPWYGIGVSQDNRVRPDLACQQAATELMYQLQSQMPSGQCKAQAPVVVVCIDGATIIVATIDNSRILSAGVKRGLTYAVRGGYLKNPINGETVAGQVKVCDIVITDTDGAAATGQVVQGSAGLIKVGDRVTLIPGQSVRSK